MLTSASRRTTFEGGVLAVEPVAELLHVTKNPSPEKKIYGGRLSDRTLLADAICWRKNNKKSRGERGAGRPSRRILPSPSGTLARAPALGGDGGGDMAP